MKKLHFHQLALLVAALGLGCGGVARHFTAQSPVSVTAVSKKPAVNPDLRAPLPRAAPHSADTLDSLASLKNGELYSHLALWLVDASEDDIAAYWKTHLEGKRDREITILIFLAWTRLNPQAALAAAGSEDEEFVWQAWACNDPQAAWAAATAAGGKRIENVARGLARFHPAWLREHFDELPQETGKAALAELWKWGDSENPLEMLKFDSGHGIFSSATFGSLVSKDPWAALEWGKGNWQAMQILVSQMTEESPDELARLAAQSPPGETRRLLEAGLFANLIKADPEAAMAQAMSIKVPRIAAERCAAVGLAWVKKDPAKAFEVAEHLFAVCPDAILMKRPFEFPGSSGSISSGINGVSDLMKSLMFQDPVKAMNIVTAIPQNSSHDDYAFDELSDLWLQQDVTAYAGWVKDQNDPAIRRNGMRKVIGQLQKDGQYRDAADWSLSVSISDRPNVMRSMFNTWGQKNLAEALGWLEATDLSAEEKRQVRNNFGP